MLSLSSTADATVRAQQISDAQIEMKKASENREKENKEFQQTVADQRATQEILKKAMERLGEFYNKKAALAQTGQVPGAILGKSNQQTHNKHPRARNDLTIYF